MNPENPIAILDRTPKAALRERRFLNEMGALGQIERGAWNDRFRVRGVDWAADGGVVIHCRLRAPGLVMTAGGRIEERDVWNLDLQLSRFYPLSQPTVLFSGPAIPFCPHVLSMNPQFEQADERLRHVAENGRGACCWIGKGEWTSDFRTHNLAFVCWVASRLVVYELGHAEEGALNPQARDHYLRLRESGRLPLGRALPYPFTRGGTRHGVASGEAPVDWGDEVVGEQGA